MSRRGRASKPESERLRAVLAVRLTDEEYDAAYRLATKERKRLTECVRDIIRAAIFRKHQIRSGTNLS